MRVCGKITDFKQVFQGSGKDKTVDNLTGVDQLSDSIMIKRPEVSKGG